MFAVRLDIILWRGVLVQSHIGIVGLYLAYIGFNLRAFPILKTGDYTRLEAQAMASAMTPPQLALDQSNESLRGKRGSKSLQHDIPSKAAFG